MIATMQIQNAADSEEILTAEGCYITECWNRPDDADVSIAKARVAPNSSTVKHRLDVDERYIVTAGRGVVVIDDECVNAGAGDVIFIPAGSVQHVINQSSENFVFYCVCTPRFRDVGYHAVEAPT